ncbi:MAG: hypothetical protein R3E88_02880 [Myxococcota bacterium]|nr:hypothetical protein [Myxococcales bacterium]
MSACPTHASAAVAASSPIRAIGQRAFTPVGAAATKRALRWMVDAHTDMGAEGMRRR